MNILLLMIPLSILLGSAFVTAFIWAAKSGQFDDTETPGVRIFFDEEVDDNKEKQ